jgi:predicted DNA-binding transcriptional regulator YafY
MRLQRLLLILFYLQGRGLVTITELTELLEVSKRTVYRDIDELRTAGADIIGVPGSGGGFRLSDDFKLEKLIFSKSELIFLIFATRVLSKFRETEFARQADEFSEKLERIFGSPEIMEQELAEVILIDTEDRFPKVDSHSKLQMCEKALFDAVSLDIAYESPFCEMLSTRNRVDPYGIVNKAGYWFLIGYCHELEIYRAFNTTYIKDIELTGERFSKDRAFNLKSFWEKVRPG